jgi:hypothetical protein
MPSVLLVLKRRTKSGEHTTRLSSSVAPFPKAFPGAFIGAFAPWRLRGRLRLRIMKRIETNIMREEIAGDEAHYTSHSAVQA